MKVVQTPERAKSLLGMNSLEARRAWLPWGEGPLPWQQGPADSPHKPRVSTLQKVVQDGASVISAVANLLVGLQAVTALNQAAPIRRATDNHDCSIQKTLEVSTKQHPFLPASLPHHLTA
jgi:hypothetical protein